MAIELDTAVEAFRTRPLDAGPYAFGAANTPVLKGAESSSGRATAYLSQADLPEEGTTRTYLSSLPTASPR